MKLAASRAIAGLAKEQVPLEIIASYGALSFGPDYVIPTPFDPRLLFTVSSAVAKKAMGNRRCNATNHRLGSL